MMQRLRELLASGLVAVAVLIVLWWVLNRIVRLALWIVNGIVLVVVVLVLLAAARRLRRARQPRVKL